MWPDRPTAFVVIHGAGVHRPFETLDQFVRGFRRVLRASNPDLDRWWRHGLWRHVGGIEHYVSLEPQGKPRLGFYEYYWDRYVEHEIALSEVIQWLFQVSDSAKKFYRNKPESARQHQTRGSDLFKDGDFKVGGYFIPLGRLGTLLRVLQRVGLAPFPVVSTAVSLLLSRIARLTGQMMGDVVIYTAADTRSTFYEARERVLRGVLELLRLLVEDDRYRQVIVVGHSLGSVIGYDALNRLILEMNSEGGILPAHGQKITGLVTLGSPLDKVAFYFREHTPRDAYIRRQMLTNVYAFKSRPFPGDRTRIVIRSPVTCGLANARWLNFYHLQDPVSGHLDAYSVDRNILCEREAKGPAEAHRMYWTHDRLYEEICVEFFGCAADAH